MNNLFFILFITVTFQLNSQNLYNNQSAFCVGYYPTNQSFETAFPLCGLGKAVTWDSTLISNCSFQNPKFHYSCKLNSSSTIAFDGLKGPSIVPIGGVSYPVYPNALTIIRIYGPYSDGISLYQAALLIQQGLLPVQNYNSNTSSGGLNININQAGNYLIQVEPNFCSGCIGVFGLSGINCNTQDPVNCANCITSFSPQAGKYMVSAWVKEENDAVGTLNYTNSQISVSYNGSAATPTNLTPSGQIIDGWQRIEGEIEILAGTTDISLTLSNTVVGGVSYFDDIRFFPFNGSMMSYVYDPETLRLVAELDERNYAKFYEYDEEGKLIRVKKETERGVMTIQENRNNTRK